MADEMRAYGQALEKIKAIDLPRLNPIETDSVPKKSQSLQEFSMAGGGVPAQYKGREHVWHKKVQKFAEGGGVYNTNPDMSDGGQIIPGPAYAKGGSVKSEDRAAFGVFPQMKPKRSKQDPEAAKNVPVDLARGFVAGTLGMPGDIESLVRIPYDYLRTPTMSELISDNKTSKTYLPTSEDMLKRIPFGSDTPVSNFASGLGLVGGGFYTGPGSAGRAAFNVTKDAAKGAMAAGRAGERMAEKYVPQIMERGGLGAGVLSGLAQGSKSSVIKPKGGNFLTGSVEGSLSGLKKNPTAAKSLEEMRKVYPPDVLKFMSPETRVAVDRAFPHLEKEVALNKWIDSNLGNYIKKEMATPEDPVRKLADKGITHLPEDELNRANWLSSHMELVRAGEGYPSSGLATSDMGRGWENLADEAIQVTSPKVANQQMLLDNPFLSKLDPDQSVYRARPADINTLGFDHVLDVLREDVAAGRIRPEQLSKVSIEQAVRRTSEYDQEMAKKMREAQIKNTEKMPTYKEYPEGFKWLQLSKSKDLPEGYTQESSGAFLSPTGERTIFDPRQESLRNALKYEGDTMGHCVGNYCEDVAKGKSRIFSLRDAKGEPHVTIETSPGSVREYDNAVNALSDADMFKHGQLSKKLLSEDKSLNYGDADQMAYEQLFGRLPERIVQIKGKQNAAPKEEYLPFVQDFVRSGQFSDVGDFRNTGLFRKSDLVDKFSPDELNALGKGDYLNKQEYDDLLYKQLNQLRPGLTDELGLTTPPIDGMARGGAVHMQKGGKVVKEAIKLGIDEVKALLGMAKEAPKGVEPILVKPAERAAAGIAPTSEERVAIEKFYSGAKMSKADNIAAGLYHPVGGGTKLSKPVSSMRSTTVPDPAFKSPAINILTPEQLVKEKAALIPLVGDRAAAGKYLTHIEDNELEKPVRLTGGARYMDANYNPANPEQSAAWESGLGRVTALGRQAERAGEGGRPVYGIYTAGSGTNTDFNIMGANALLQQIPFSKITKKAEREFDRAMRVDTPNWPGIRSPEAEAMLLDKSNGIVRTKLFENMGKESFQSMGFPDVPATRKSIIEPELLDVPTNQAGFRMARMDTTGRIIAEPTIRSDYPGAMAGNLAGKLDEPADYKDIFQSHFDARRLLGQPESGDYYSFSRAHPIQYADQEWLDKLMKQRELRDKMISGKKKGGSISKTAELKKVGKTKSGLSALEKA